MNSRKNINYAITKLQKSKRLFIIKFSCFQSMMIEKEEERELEGACGN